MSNSDRMRHTRRELNDNYRRLRAILISRDLDPELAEALHYAPELYDLYDTNKLIVALAIINHEFQEDRVTLNIKPIIYNALKFQAYTSGVFIHSQMNDSLGEAYASVIHDELLHKVSQVMIQGVRCK